VLVPCPTLQQNMMIGVHIIMEKCSCMNYLEHSDQDVTTPTPTPTPMVCSQCDAFPGVCICPWQTPPNWLVVTLVLFFSLLNFSIIKGHTTTILPLVLYHLLLQLSTVVALMLLLTDYCIFGLLRFTVTVSLTACCASKLISDNCEQFVPQKQP